MRQELPSAVVDPVAAAEDEKKERKKLQNRRNQRARRTRLREAKEEHNDSSARPFSVRRWRINQDEESSPVSKTSLQEEISNAWERQLVKSTGHIAPVPTTSPFSDLLLHLIHQNIFRGFSSNKTMLHRQKPDFQLDLPHTRSRNTYRAACPGLILTLPTGPNMPVSLIPTHMQMNIPHPGWIDIIPFPRMRDNLIKWHDSFDHWEFLGDMVGFLADGAVITKRQTPTASQQVDASGENAPEPDEEVYSPLSGWKGAIIWGEPYLKESWEFRAPFLRKWAWVIEGCDDIVDLSNTWRTGRGESPLQLPRMVAV